MPDALELPRVLRAVVPLMGGERLAGCVRRVISELVAGFGRPGGRVFANGRTRLQPGLAAVVGALDDLPEPSARLRRIDAIGVHGRTFHVVDFPSREKRTADRPVFALGLRAEDERALFCADQHTYTAHHPTSLSCQLLLFRLICGGGHECPKQGTTMSDFSRSAGRDASDFCLPLR
jgi:hypothetical protein